MNSLVRRRSGMYVVRLVVPPALRSLAGKRELIQSTGQRDLPAAKVVGTQILAAMRQRLADLARHRIPPMDLDRIAAGHPAIGVTTHLRLGQAASLSGFTESELLEFAAAGRLDLLTEVHQLRGHWVPLADLDRAPAPDGGGLEIPANASHLPPSARASLESGWLWVMPDDRSAVAYALLAARPATLVALTGSCRGDQAFLPDGTCLLTATSTGLLASQLESLRQAVASRLAPAQREAHHAATAARPSHDNGTTDSQRPLSDVITEYVTVRGRRCAPDQIRRVQSALELFDAMAGHPRLCNVTDKLVTRYRDEQLPQVPANENKVRLQHGTRSVMESIEAVRGTDWPPLSAREQVKRLDFLHSFFVWVSDKGFLPRNPATGLVKESQALAVDLKNKERHEVARDRFSSEQLGLIFSQATWFRTGRGMVTRQGTIRTFCPYYYWLPLLGLHTGARINELCQLDLDDIRTTPTGVVYIAIAELDEDGKKRRKNAQSTRNVPVAPLLLELGLLGWRDALRSAGYQRLFPELKYNEIKGYGKAATNWFSRYLRTLGWARDGKLVFHSFRSTLATYLAQVLRLNAVEVAAISGHREMLMGVLNKHYIKPPSVEELAQIIGKVDFQLPTIAPFDMQAGLQAVKDALDRKDRGRGAEED